MRFRYFDAEAGRWCSPDPLGFGAGANLLALDGSPAVDVDPFGLECSRQKGVLAERYARRYLKSLGYEILGSITNTSGHGIDLVVRDRSGNLVFVEIKANKSRMSPAQAEGANSFVPSRLDRATDWGRTKDPNTSTKAQALVDETQGQPITGKVVRVDLDNGTITETPW